ncbi:efflux transporter outer membrane subunit [Acetobacter orleanensis]|uniref:Outer membrane efflux protein n=1 Tax=Acetobacter orleanensis TaxID=104099 RepID=A0A4Y3TNZ1_9PROT|nr:efflux transporter outer membrane subunit [Acetobacter orleanensis]KXV65739.1 hypothetical protein AD949_04025 [Acetobacter orleanensis]PCD78634.1 hypothetical protein CO710_11215 [Acetobacter orleanensis]GAN67303.1 secretion system type I outer membrane efflux pump lipoprotein NodT [Acetobacter orleanensis JCM 7639]GBR23870.1 outer membrane protein [Acetobacter orleanensis NRIC 0473]GEB83562.1 outer membrane efflux protein [Acetobacter orleanensis]
MRRERLVVGRMPALISCIMLAACTLGPDYHQPATDLPKTLQNISETAQKDWWTNASVRPLAQLQAQALTGNLDLQIARSRVAAAAAIRQATAAASFPMVMTDTSYSRAALSTAGSGQTINRLLGIPDQASNPSSPVGFNLFSAGAAASWEANLWGKQTREREIATAGEQATQARQMIVSLGVKAEVARTYIEWLEKTDEIALLQSSLHLASEKQILTSELARKGMIRNDLILLQQNRVRQKQGRMSAAMTDRTLLQRALSVLCTGRPDSDLRPLHEQSRWPIPIELPYSITTDLLKNRPDIVAADAKLHAATAAIGIAKASFYPTLTLSGVFSVDAMSLSSFGWAAHNFALGPALRVPVFTGGRLSAELALKKVNQKEAAISYQQVVNNAWHEVDDTLDRLHQVDADLKWITENNIAREKIERMAKEQAVRGWISRKDLLSIREDSIETEIIKTQQRSLLLLEYVAFRRSIGL